MTSVAIRSRARRLAAGTMIAAFLWAGPSTASPAVGDVIKTYGDIAQATYEDALTAAKRLKATIDGLLAKPGDDTLKGAREAWKAARIPYMQTEAFRFGNKIVDEWEGKVNAWPLDEGLIDYVAPSYGSASDSNPLYTANVIANRAPKINGMRINADRITKSLLKDTLHEAGKIEANVATGYHAIEFLLWGQDLNGTGPGAGTRPATDFANDRSRCTGGNCDRRRQYLKVATELLVDELAWMTRQWATAGAARKALAGPPNAALTSIFTGIASLSYGEMAGERMKLGLLLNDPEEEHDCFSDNTHNSHYYDIVGIENVYLGRYARIDGRVIQGPSVSDLVRSRSAETDERVKKALAETHARMSALKVRAETKEAYDQMIGEGNAEGNTVVETAIGALVAQTREFERAIAVLELKSVKIEGSDSLDDPGKALAGKR